MSGDSRAVADAPSTHAATQPRALLVIGAGLIGTSIALAVRAGGAGVSMIDRDPAVLDTAVGLGAGTAWSQAQPRADLAVLAVPPSAVPDVLFEAQRRDLARSYTDVASVKVEVIEAVRRRGCDVASFVPAHPMAGAESSGPSRARADLFRGAPWVLCADARTSPQAVAAVEGLARLCGATPVEMDAEAHDTAVALTSHSAHLVSSAMAGALAEADPAALRLAGTGIRDVTRIAAGDPALWTDILGANATRVAAFLSGIAADLFEACAALELVGTGDATFLAWVTDLLARGRAGRRRLDPEPASDPDP